MAIEYRFIKPVQGYAYAPGDQSPLYMMNPERRAELVRLGYLEEVEVADKTQPKFYDGGNYETRPMRGRPKKEK